MEENLLRGQNKSTICVLIRNLLPLDKFSPSQPLRDIHIMMDWPFS
jgi:hypothetical protein